MIIGSSQGRVLTEKLQLQALVTANLLASIFVWLFRLHFHGSEIRLNVATILKGSFQRNRVNKSTSSYTYRNERLCFRSEPQASSVAVISWWSYFIMCEVKQSRSQWPRGLKRGSAVAGLLRLRVRIPRGPGYMSLEREKNNPEWFYTDARFLKSLQLKGWPKWFQTDGIYFIEVFKIVAFYGSEIWTLGKMKKGS